MSVEGDKMWAELHTKLSLESELKKGYPNGVRLLALNYPQYKQDFDDYLDGIYGDNVKGLTNAEIDAIEAKLFKNVPGMKALEERFTGLEANIGVASTIKAVGKERHGAVVNLLGWITGKKK